MRKTSPSGSKGTSTSERDDFGLILGRDQTELLQVLQKYDALLPSLVTRQWLMSPVRHTNLPIIDSAEGRSSVFQKEVAKILDLVFDPASTKIGQHGTDAIDAKGKACARHPDGQLLSQLEALSLRMPRKERQDTI